MRLDKIREINILNTKSGMPYVVIDNFFHQTEVDQMLNELDFIRDSFVGPDQTGGALNDEGEYIKKNMGLMHHDFYARPDLSSIYRNTRQYFDDSFLDPLKEQAWFLRYITKNLNAYDAIQMLYYEDADKYDSHIDAATITFLCWLHRKPKSFDGGDLILEGESKVECKNNRVLVFPSIAWHQVTPLSMTEKKHGYGRYCISNFIHINS